MIHHSIFYIYSKEGTDYSALAKLHGRRGEEIWRHWRSGRSDGRIHSGFHTDTVQRISLICRECSAFRMIWFQAKETHLVTKGKFVRPISSSHWKCIGGIRLKKGKKEQVAKWYQCVLVFSSASSCAAVSISLLYRWILSIARANMMFVSSQSNRFPANSR